MFNLNLDVMEEKHSNIDFTEILNDYLNAKDNLDTAEQKFDELNRAYENLIAIQNVVQKYGWNEVLNDLIGDQVSAESLDSSCEGIKDMLKKGASAAAGAFKNFVDKSFNSVNAYTKKFNDAQKWLIKNKSSIRTAGTSDNGHAEGAPYYPIEGLVEAYKHLENNDWHWTAKQYKNYPNTVDSVKIDYTTCSVDGLIKYCKSAAAHLGTIMKIRENVKKDSSVNREGEKRAKSSNDEFAGEVYEIRRAKDFAKKWVINKIIMSCTGLYKAIVKLGYKPA